MVLFNKVSVPLFIFVLSPKYVVNEFKKIRF